MWQFLKDKKEQAPNFKDKKEAAINIEELKTGWRHHYVAVGQWALRDSSMQERARTRVLTPRRRSEEWISNWPGGQEQGEQGGL